MKPRVLHRRAVSPIVTALLLLTAVPAFAQNQLASARTALRTGDYEEAVGQFRRALRARPNSAEAGRGLIAAYRAVGRYADGRDVAEDFARANAGSLALSNSLGEMLLLLGDRAGAERAFRRAGAAASDSLRARFNLGVVLLERGQSEAASREFDRFIDVYNGASSLTSEELTLVASAVRYLSRDNYELAHDAVRAFDEAIAKDPGNLEPRLLLGELFLERYDGTQSLEMLDEVIAANPNHPEALLALARAEHFNGSPKAMELVERSLDVNPNLVAARVFRSVLLLQLEDFEAAATEIDRALEVNPNSLEALSVRAALEYLRGDRTSFEATVAHVLGLNARYADLYNTVAEVSARNRLYADAAEFARQATTLDPRSWRGHALLGINLLRAGRMAEGRASLEAAFDGNPFDVWTKNTLDLLDTMEEYPVTDSRRFRFAIDGEESELLALYLEELAEEAYERLAQRYGYRPATPIRIEVFTNHADFSVRTVGLVGLGALGVSFGPVIAMDSPSAQESGTFNWGSTFWHELAHTFHLGLSEHRVPRWFTEGLAVYEERQARPGWGDDVTPSFLAALSRDRLVDVSELNNGFMRPSYPEQLIHSYYQASLVCELIVERHGARALLDMLHGYRRGLDTPEVFRTVLGVEVRDFDRTFDRYLRERFAGPLASLRHLAERGDSAHAAPEELAARADEAPDDFVLQLTKGRTLLQAGNVEEAIAYLERARSLFPEYAGSDSPYWFLAMAYEQQGDLAAAARQLAAMTAVNERHHAARMKLAELSLALGDTVGAAAALEGLLYVDPLDMEVHRRLAELYEALGQWPRAVRERRAVLALRPVDLAEARYQLARAYLAGGDLEGARREVLRALEHAPNFPEAQDLLLEIHSRRQRTER